MLKRSVILLIACLVIMPANGQAVEWEPDNLSVGQTSRLYITAKDTIFAVTGAGLFRTTNKGQSWDLVFDEFVYGPIELPGGTLLGSDYSRLIVSTDGGTSWTPGAYREVRSYFLDGNRLLAGGAWGELWEVKDNLQTWTVLNQPVLDQQYLSPVAEIYARGDLLVYKHVLSGLWVSRNGGQSWELQPYYFVPPFLYPVGDSVYLLHDFEGASGLASTKDCLTYTKLANNPHELPNAGAFKGNLFVIGGLEGPYVSIDYGATWTLSKVGLDDELIHSLAIDGDGYLYAGTHAGVQRSKTSLVATASESPEELPFDLRASPNPFIGHTTLMLTLSQPQQVSLEAFNVLGQRVQQIEKAFLNTGQHRFTFEASSLSAGVYFLRVSGKNRTLTIRVTLVE